MRSLFSVVGLLVVLAVIGVIASRQLSGLRAPPVAATALSGAAVPIQGTAAQLPAQYKQALEATLQTARPIDDGTK